MIGKTKRGSQFRALAVYLYGPGKRNEHTSPRSIATGNTFVLFDTRWWEWVEEMDYCAALRPRISTPVWHTSLSAAPGDRPLSDTQWAQLATEYMQAMQLGGHPWVAVRHGDNHIHVVACRVNSDGEAWKGSYDYYKSMKALRAIERRHRLTIVDDTYQPDEPRMAQASIAERESAARRGKRDPERALLRDALSQALDAAQYRGAQAFETELQQRGVQTQRVLGRGERLRGYLVTMPGWVDKEGKEIWLRTAQVDKQLGWRYLQQQLSTPAIAAALAERAATTRTGNQGTTTYATTTRWRPPARPGG